MGIPGLQRLSYRRISNLPGRRRIMFQFELPGHASSTSSLPFRPFPLPYSLVLILQFCIALARKHSRSVLSLHPSQNFRFPFLLRPLMANHCTNICCTKCGIPTSDPFCLECCSVLGPMASFGVGPTLPAALPLSSASSVDNSAIPPSAPPGPSQPNAFSTSNSNQQQVHKLQTIQNDVDCADNLPSVFRDQVSCLACVNTLSIPREF